MGLTLEVASFLSGYRFYGIRTPVGGEWLMVTLC